MASRQYLLVLCTVALRATETLAGVRHGVEQAGTTLRPDFQRREAERNQLDLINLNVCNATF